MVRQFSPCILQLCDREKRKKKERKKQGKGEYGRKEKNKLLGRTIKEYGIQCIGGETFRRSQLEFFSLRNTGNAHQAHLSLSLTPYKEPRIFVILPAFDDIDLRSPRIE
jgi:hypothetical protein